MTGQDAAQRANIRANAVLDLSTASVYDGSMGRILDAYADAAVAEAVKERGRCSYDSGHPRHAPADLCGDCINRLVSFAIDKARREERERCISIVGKMANGAAYADALRRPPASAPEGTGGGR